MHLLVSVRVRLNMVTDSQRVSRTSCFPVNSRAILSGRFRDVQNLDALGMLNESAIGSATIS